MTKRTKVVATLTALTLVTSCFIGGTIARYVTSTSSEDEARVAIWGINGDTVTMELFNSEYDVNGSTVAKSRNGDKIIAPGTSMSSKFSIMDINSTIAPEVMYEVGINLDDSEIDPAILSNTSIQWKLDNNAWGTWEDCKDDILALTGDIGGKKVYAPNTVPQDFADGQEHTIAWQWLMDNNNDDNDTLMGNAAVNGDLIANISIAVTARQVDVDTSSMLSGDGSIFNVKSPAPITFRSVAPFTELQEVKVGDTTLNEGTDYVAREGSTVIELSKSYLKTLESGRYVVSIVSANTTAKATFTVIEKTLEQDSEGNYLISSADDLRLFSEMVNNGSWTNRFSTVLLTKDIDLQNKPFIPIGKTKTVVNGDGTEKHFRGIFDGQGHTIYNLNITATDQDTNNSSSAGLFAILTAPPSNTEKTEVKNLKVDGATITSTHFAGVIAGTTANYAKITNCEVRNATITSTYYNDENSGDKAGVIIGNSTSIPITNCHVYDSTVTASRDAGQITGCAYENAVTNCTATNVTVSHNGLGTGANIRNEIIGRILSN